MRYLLVDHASNNVLDESSSRADVEATLEHLLELNPGTKPELEIIDTEEETT